MATHKVPQDVEAEDKLIGFLSLRQFVMVLVGLGFGYLTFIFFVKVHPIASIIWIPPTIICLVLGLYQRKDQPVEVYLASALRFYLKPRTRRWDQDGYEERVIVTAPARVEKRYTKDFTGEEATNRLDNLSRLMDSRGWTSKLAGEWQNPQLATAAAGDRLMQPGSASLPQDQQALGQPVDMMDAATSRVAQNFQTRIQQTDTANRQRAVQTAQQVQTTDPAPATVTATPKPLPPPQPAIDPQRLHDLATADDLNIQALAAEAKHISNSEVEVKFH